MIDMSELMYDPDFIQPELVTILRGKGMFDGHGLYEPEEIKELRVTIIIQQSSEKQLLALPEGERNTDTINWWMAPKMQMADGITIQLSDVILWRDRYYRVTHCGDRSDNGYWTGMAQAAPNTGGTVNPDRETLQEQLTRRKSWAVPGSRA